jgi:hypothetical protein
MYAEPHRHDQWADHRVRVDVTIALARHMVERGGTVADLSCGDATIARALAVSHDARLFLGDYAPGYEFTGPVEDTIEKLPEQVGLFICSETIEHVADPDALLAAIRARAANLILSTPAWETDSGNPEHIWGWDPEDIEEMLDAAGFTPLTFTQLDLRPAGFVYCYQIWGCR